MPVELRRLNIVVYNYRIPYWIDYNWYLEKERMLDGDPETFGRIIVSSSIGPVSGTFLVIFPLVLNIPVWGNKLWFYEVGVRLGNVIRRPDSVNTTLVRWDVFFVGTTNIIPPTYNQPARLVKDDLIFTTFCLRDYYNLNVLPLAEGYSTLMSITPPEITFTSPQNTTVKLTMSNLIIDKSQIDTSAYPVTQYPLGSESAFDMLFPKVSVLNSITSLKILVYFVFQCQPNIVNESARPLLEVEIYDIYLKVPSPSGDVYIWDENTGLSFVNSGENTAIYDKDTSTYIQTSSSAPRRGILTVFPYRINVPGTPLKVYAKSSDGTPQMISYYTGVDTVPPPGSPTAQITVTDSGWYTLLTDSLVDWSYFII